MEEIMSIHEKIRDKAAGYRHETALLLSELVKIPSYSGREEAVCSRIAEMCGSFGFDEVRIDGLGSVIARIGNGAKILSIDAHIDTVETGDRSQWTDDPFSGTIRDGLVYGRGASDQKGGAAAMLTAGRVLKELEYAGKYSIYLTFTVMEEDCDGMCWKYLIEEEGLTPDLFVSTEPTHCIITRGQRGRMEMECTFRGVSSHGSAPDRGDSAAYKAARAALAMERLNGDLKPDPDNFLGKGSIVVSKMEVSGPSQCAVPDRGMIYLDRRLTSGETAESAVDEVKRYMGDDLESVRMPEYRKRGYRGTDYGQELYFPTWMIPEDHPFVESARETYRRLFSGEAAVGRWTFSTNGVAVCGRHGIPSIGFGPGDEEQAHAPNEVNRIDDLETCSAFYAMLPYILDEREDLP
jgi:putative selenium metabolism hydrolase